MTGWDRLIAELDAWAAEGRTAGFWWRDDDAADGAPELDRLLALRRALGVPLVLAVIPAAATPALAEMLKDEADIERVQHGYAHTNHAAAGEKKAELGGTRALWDVARDLADGRGRMGTLFGDDGWLEVIVPPWNRIDPSVAGLLPGLGFHGLSGFGKRNLADAGPELNVVNTHIDIIAWRDGRGFAGEDAVLDAAVELLAAKRAEGPDDHGAIGLLTHHLAHDPACWDFIERFVTVTQNHPAALWRAGRDMFPVPDLSVAP